MNGMRASTRWSDGVGAGAVGSSIALAGVALLGVVLATGFDSPRMGYLLVLGAFGGFCWSTRWGLSVQIAVGFAAALLLALLQNPPPALGAETWLHLDSHIEVVAPVGSAFVSLLKMMIGPLILFSITAAIGRMADARSLGRMGTRTVGLYLGTMAAAVATGLLIANWIEPGAGSVLRDSEFFRASVTQERSLPDDLSLANSLSSIVVDVLQNPLASLARGRILPIFVFAVLLGVALLQIGERGRPLIELIDSGYAATMKMIEWFVRLAPIGVFAIVGPLFARLPFGELATDLGTFIFVVFLATSLHAFVTLPALGWWLARVHPLELLRGIREALMVAFTTSSSVATLPVTTRNVQENLGVSAPVASFVLPLGATVNMDGTALYEAMAALFVAAIYGIDLSLGSQLVIFAVSMLMAVGAPGIPSAGMTTMVVVLEAVQLPGEAVGLLLPLDRILDTIRTMANVEGDAVIAACVDRDRSI